MSRIRYAIFSTVLCFALVAAHAAQFEVDCDAGDNLGEVLSRVARLRPANQVPGDNGVEPAELLEIVISGTCVGNFALTSGGVALKGAGPGPESAVLSGAAPKTSVTPVLAIRYAQDVLLENLTVTGGSTGVRLLRSAALVRNCRMLGNGTGISSESSQTRIEESLVSQNRDGVRSLAADLMVLDHTDIVGNEQIGVFAIGGSNLTIDSGEIRDNLFGLYVLDNASAFLRQELVIGETLGGAHVTAINHSTVTINDGVAIQGGDSIEIVNQSLLEASNSPIQANLKLIQSGRAFLDGTQLDGFVTLDGFSQAVISATVSGPVVCDATSNADCSAGTIGAVIDCDSCQAAPPGAP